jgi:hypothetical protein
MMKDIINHIDWLRVKTAGTGALIVAAIVAVWRIA